MKHPRENQRQIVGDRLLLRPVVVEDARVFSEITGMETFRYFVTSVPKEKSEAGFRPFVDYLLNDRKTQGYAITIKETGEIVGSSSYMDIRPSDFHVEIGLTWYAENHRGTFVNPECKLLMLTEAFEFLEAKKVTLKCDGRNIHSQNAIRKLGAKYEGTLRKHRFTDYGDFRDTAYFSILLEEWPEVKTGLQERLKAYN